MSHRDTKVYVGNLSSSTTRGDLEYEFEYYGRLINVWVAKSPPGFAYVEFEDYRDAEDAIKGLDGRELQGRRIRVEWSHGGPRGRESFGVSGGGRGRRSFHPSDRCYNCGESGHYAYDCDLYHRRNSRSSRRRRSYSRSRSRSRSRTPRRRRRSRSNSRSRSRSPRRRSPSKSRSRSRSRGRRSRSDSRGKRSGSESRKRKSRDSSEEKVQNGDRSPSRSRSRSRSRS